jgi:transcriptional regulator with XRE-family HTH domain
MAYPKYLREKARQLRRERKLTIDELAECLALPRTTIYYWVRDQPIPRTTRQSVAQRRGSRAMQLKYRGLREAAYDEGRSTFAELSADPSFRDFVCLYIAEGYKRSRNVVALANADPIVIRLAAKWTRRFASNTISYSIQYHADQDLDELQCFWASQLRIDPTSIRLQRKSNSSGLAGRTWRSRYGVLTVAVGDTYLRARLQAWMDLLHEHWIDSLTNGV